MLEVAVFVDPLLSTAVTVIVYVAEREELANEYVWLSVVVPGVSVSTFPSPQFTLIPVTVPSGSEDEIVRVTAWPDETVAEGGVHVMTGGWSMIVTLGVAADVRPLLSCTVTVIV